MILNFTNKSNKRLLKNYYIEALRTLIKDLVELKNRLGEEEQMKILMIWKTFKDGVDGNELLDSEIYPCCEKE